MTTKQEAIARIEAAFAHVARPTNEDMHHPRSSDNTDLQPLFEIAHWRDMTEADVIEAYAAPSFLSAEGFRHFIPAYMCHALRNPDGGEAYVSGTIWQLDPNLYAEELATYVRSKYALFDDAQRAAVVAFLTAMTDSVYGDDALHALQEWH